MNKRLMSEKEQELMLRRTKRKKMISDKRIATLPEQKEDRETDYAKRR